MINRKRCDSDRRVVYVEISDKGLEILKKIDISELDSNMKKISEDEAKTLNAILDKIR